MCLTYFSLMIVFYLVVSQLECEGLMKIFNKYSMTSGQVINLDKFNIHFSPATNPSDR